MVLDINWKHFISLIIYIIQNNHYRLAREATKSRRRAILPILSTLSRHKSWLIHRQFRGLPIKHTRGRLTECERRDATDGDTRVESCGVC